MDKGEGGGGGGGKLSGEGGDGGRKGGGGVEVRRKVGEGRGGWWSTGARARREVRGKDEARQRKGGKGRGGNDWLKPFRGDQGGLVKEGGKRLALGRDGPVLERRGGWRPGSGSKKRPRDPKIPWVEKRGGARSGAGRKRIENKVSQVPRAGE